MNATHYGPRITTYDRPRWCSVCGCQRETKNKKFIPHQKPNSKPSDPNCENSGKSVKATQEEAQG